MIPGRGLTLGLTLSIVSIVVIAPVAALVLSAVGITPAHVLEAAFSARALAAYRLSLVCSLGAAMFDVLVGVAVAAVLVRHRHGLDRWLNVLVDIPFAIPTSVAGIALATLYGPNGWLGAWLAEHGIPVAYTPLGIAVALAFVGLPFVVRTVEPVLALLPRDVHEAAASLGAHPFTVTWRITLPLLFPAILTGFALAFGRMLGEYGSVIFIAGNLPLRTEIPPLLIVTRLEEYDYTGAAAIALVSLAASFLILLAINALQRRLSTARAIA
ncbi:MAG: sulfate ABC transporter permease subunit CysT [Candidatus Lustribacter sp.]|jgi:sulfate transport system permease protein